MAKKAEQNSNKMKKVEKNLVGSVENAVSHNELNELVQLVKATMLADKKNKKLQIQNYYTVYLGLAKEPNKKLYKENVAIIAKLAGISIGRWANLQSRFNKALKYKLDVTKYISDKSLEDDIRALVQGDKKVLKNGKVINDVKGAAKNVADKVEIQAVNENEIIELLANPEFKNAMKFIEKNGILKATFMKAWAQHQAK